MGTTVEIFGEMSPQHERVLTDGALELVAELCLRFSDRVEELLEARQRRQREIDDGAELTFPEETAEVRASSWRVEPVPGDLRDRRVEITGPVDRKMIINALNSGAKVFMADFEDSNAPTWNNVVLGQGHLMDAVRRTIRHEDPTRGRVYELVPEPATLMVRPRGWHLPEAHVEIEGRPAVAALFDFGLYFYHNADELRARGTGPYFYLPKLESYHEARLWNDVFVLAQKRMGIPRGTIKATVLIETLPAAFQMDEILWELREHSAGLNCGRWDYIFSTIKTFRRNPDWVLPDRSQVTMTQPFMKAYTDRLVQVCHRRGAHAMGGMAAQIPIKDDPAANEEALAKVRADKLREVRAGHDGTWVAHPGLVDLARAIFDEHMPQPNQIPPEGEELPMPTVTAAELVRPPEGTRTEAGLRQNLDVGVQYLAAWLGGSGCVPLYALMEDAATAEISRAQIWQWVAHRARLDDGRFVTAQLVRHTLEDQMQRMVAAGAEQRFGRDALAAARKLFLELVLDDELADFLTLPAYELLMERE